MQKRERKQGSFISILLITVQEKDFSTPPTKSYHRKEKCEDRTIPDSSNKWDGNGKISVIKDTRLEQNY